MFVLVRKSLSGQSVHEVVTHKLTMGSPFENHTRQNSNARCLRSFQTLLHHLVPYSTQPFERIFSHLPTHQAHEGLLASAFGEQVKQRYLVFARAVDAYNTRLYVEWEQRVGAVATEKLKQPILCALNASRGHASSENVLDGAATKEALGHNFNGPVKYKVSAHQQAAVSSDPKGFGIPPPPYGVNFATELHMIIRESKYLDRMGFQVGLAMRAVLDPAYMSIC